MQPQSGATSSPYYNQYYPAAAAAPDLPPFNPVSAAPYASAPPVAASPSDYAFPSNYASFPPNHPDHVPNPPQYSFPHLQDTSQNHQLYNQNQAPVDYDYGLRNPNTEPAYDPSYSLNSYSYGDAPYHANSYESSLNYGGDQTSYDNGVYKYNGGPVESSYGGKGGRSSDTNGGGSGVLFDDYGRPITVPGGEVRKEYGTSSPKIVRAVPKVEESEDVKSGVQKFRVKLLSEGYGQTDMDVLCQVG